MTPPATVGTCAYLGCPRQLVPHAHWETLPTHERRHLLAHGFSQHSGRGLCYRCRRRANRNGTLTDYPTHTVSRNDVLTDWTHLNLDPTLSRARRIQLAAPRIGMTPAALEKALDRATREGAVA